MDYQTGRTSTSIGSRQTNPYGLLNARPNTIVVPALWSRCRRTSETPSDRVSSGSQVEGRGSNPAYSW